MADAATDRSADPAARQPDARLLRLLGGPALDRLRLRLRRRLAPQGDGDAGADADVDSGADADADVEVEVEVEVEVDQDAGAGAGARRRSAAVLRLTGLNEAEHAAIAALQGGSARPSASLTVNVAAIDQHLRKAGLASSLRDALAQIDGPIVDAAAARTQAARRWQGVLAEVNHPALQRLLQGTAGATLLRRLARQDADAARLLLQRAQAVLLRLPLPGWPRAQLAAEALGDAHALDDGRPAATLVLAALRAGAAERPEDERARNVWASAGVLVNELARPALCLNLPLQGAALAPAGEPGWVSLRRLLRAPPAWAVAGQDVFVCENPNLLAMAADRWGARCRPLVCTEGMPAAAQRTLLQELAGAGARLHYHGDFDWPGLAIGNHLARQHGARPWRFTAADYRAAAAAAGGAPLRGESVVACWDAQLAPAMTQLGWAIAEEALAAVLLPDLQA